MKAKTFLIGIVLGAVLMGSAAYSRSVSDIAGIAVYAGNNVWNWVADITAGDGISGGLVGSWSCLFNGSTCDRMRGDSATNNTATTSRGAVYAVPLSTWSCVHTPGDNLQPTCSKAAGGGTVRHVATGITACWSGTSGTPLFTINLRDGATGAGTILRTWLVRQNFGTTAGSGCYNVTGINMTGTANTAMTLEFSASPGGGNQGTVTLTGYSTP